MRAAHEAYSRPPAAALNAIAPRLVEWTNVRVIYERGRRWITGLSALESHLPGDLAVNDHAAREVLAFVRADHVTNTADLRVCGRQLMARWNG